MTETRGTYEVYYYLIKKGGTLNLPHNVFPHPPPLHKSTETLVLLKRRPKSTVA